MGIRIKSTIIRLCAVYIGLWGIMPFVIIVAGMFQPSTDQHIPMIFYVLLFMMLLIGAGMAAIGFGLWKFKEIGRKLSIFLLILHINAALLFLVSPSSNNSGKIVAISMGTIALASIVYLSRKSVKELFMPLRYGYKDDTPERR